MGKTNKVKQKAQKKKGQRDKQREKVEFCPRCHEPVDYIIGFYWQCKHCDVDADTEIHDETTDKIGSFFEKKTTKTQYGDWSEYKVQVDQNGQLQWDLGDNTADDFDLDEYISQYLDGGCD